VLIEQSDPKAESGATPRRWKNTTAVGFFYLGNSTHVLLAVRAVHVAAHVLLSDMLLAVALPESSRDGAFGDSLKAIKSTVEKVEHCGEKAVEQVGTRTYHH
jgi:hypothetical protein